ncbi:unnamed protein product [Mytilus edulis]|uniref:Uncharacterized protein n=1 Tax=Mytilus edulis TaxID=6550 RepID=A0A8S3VRE6_MYTED|nr:unnamed protein product [Mytilus edulis]
MSRTVFGIPSKMTARQFFGSHFHSLTIHAPESFRIFNLKSIVTEQEERCVGDLRRVSETTSNRQAGQIVDNAIMRVTIQQQLSYKQDSFTVQDSSISKQARLLPPRPRTTFSADLIKNRSVLVSAHLKRISDFMICGKDVWWMWEGGNVIFMDGPEDPPVHGEGPPLHNFRSSSLKKEQSYLSDIWIVILDLFENGSLELPLNKIKVFDDDGKSRFISSSRHLNNRIQKKLNETSFSSEDLDQIREDIREYQQLIYQYAPELTNQKSKSSSFATIGFNARFYSSKAYPNLTYLMDQVSKYSQGIINLQMATRKNNASLLSSSMYMANESFHGRQHHKYQIIELNDAIQYKIMLEDVRQLSVIEEKNKQLKSWIQKGVPTDEIWQTVCRNNTLLENMKDRSLSVLVLSSSKSGTHSLGIDDAVLAFRVHVRKTNYLGTPTDHTSISGMALYEGLIGFTQTALGERIHIIKQNF